MNETTTVKELDSLLATARSAAREGRPAEAHRLLTQITKREPQNVEAWLWRAATAATREDTLVALSTVVNMVEVHQKQRSKSAPLGRHDASDIEALARDSLPLSR